MLNCGSVRVCSEECRNAKMRAAQSRSVERDTNRKRAVDKTVVRAAVIKRDGNFCLLCGKRPPLHLHRVRYGSEGGKYEPENTVLLCDEHHLHTVHANKKLWKPLLLAHLAGEDGATHKLRLQLRAVRKFPDITTD